MSENEQMLAWLDRLREGVANQNAEAERACRTAMEASALLTALEQIAGLISASPSSDYASRMRAALYTLDEARWIARAAIARATPSPEEQETGQ